MAPLTARVLCARSIDALLAVLVRGCITVSQINENKNEGKKTVKVQNQTSKHEGSISGYNFKDISILEKWNV